MSDKFKIDAHVHVFTTDILDLLFLT